MTSTLDQTRITPVDLDATPATGGDPPVPEISGAANPALGPMTQRRVLGMAIPIIGENLLQTSVGAVDTFMVARVGEAALAEVGTSVELIFFIISILIAVEIGATVLIAQAIGAGDGERANRLARQAVVWGVVIAIPVSLFGFLASEPVIALFGVEPDVADAATTYLRITTATTITLLLSLLCGAVLRGAGDSRTPLMAATVANVVNVGAAYLLIFGHLGLPELGVAGSAWAATIGRAVGASILLALLFGGRRKVSIRGRVGWRPDPSTGRRFLKLGVPTAVEQGLMAGGFTTMMAVVAVLGTASLAAQQIGFTALSIAFMPGFGFAIAATALVGQSIGAGDLRAAREAARLATFWAVLWMAAGGVLYFVLAEPVMLLFTDDPEVVGIGVRALRALSVGRPFWAIWSVNGGALRGSGDTRTPMIMGAVSVWSAVGLAFVLVRWFDGGLGWVWLTFFFTAPLGALGNWLALRKRLRPGADVAALAVAAGPGGAGH